MRLTVLLVIGGLALAACGETTERAPPPPPAPPVPPTPELPIDGRKARQIIGDLPLACISLATLKANIAACDERVGRTVDHEALRTELRDLRWNLQQVTPEEATTRCSVAETELRTRPKPQACWDIGND